jgi:hypothetical protein
VIRADVVAQQVHAVLPHEPPANRDPQIRGVAQEGSRYCPRLGVRRRRSHARIPERAGGLKQLIELVRCRVGPEVLKPIDEFIDTLVGIGIEPVQCRHAVLLLSVCLVAPSSDRAIGTCDMPLLVKATADEARLEQRIE